MIDSDNIAPGRKETKSSANICGHWTGG